MKHQSATLLATVLGATLLFSSLYTPAQAQGRDLSVIPRNDNPAVDLHIEINKPIVEIGQTVEFSFRVSESGYATLWNLGTSGRATRIYPNQHGGSMWVQAGVPYGAGGPNDRYAFVATGEPGMEDVYLVWTRTPEAQPTRWVFNNPAALAKDLNVVSNQPARHWSTAQVSYELVDPRQPLSMMPLPTPSSHPTLASGDTVYIVAMGANVHGLTYTNLDAVNFARTMGALFEVPTQNVQVIENATRQQFIAAMDWLAQNIRPGDTAMIFFSGHGSTLKDDDGDEDDGLDEGFVMYDAEHVDIPGRAHMLVDDDFAALVSRLQTDRVITVIDACYSGGLRKSLSRSRPKFLRKGELGQSFAGTAEPFQAKDSAGGMDDGLNGILFSAAREDQYAYEGPRGGMFITNFLHATVHHGGDLTAAFETTRKVVEQESRGQQIPTMLGDAQLGMMLGQR